MLHTYVALLRAVNVGTTWIKMAELCELLSSLGFQNVQTYIQSGNVILSSKDSSAKCGEAIAFLLEDRLNIPICGVLKNAKELATIVADNPGIDQTKLHITFLTEKPAKSALTRLGAIKAGEDQFHASGSVIYLHCPNGYGRTKLSNAAIERALGVRATTRNWKTVSELVRMVEAI